MKPSKNDDTAPNAGRELVPVRFEFTRSTDNSVCVAGCFNHWQPEARTPHPAGDGRWVKKTVRAPGIYEYCLAVDGEWMPDPLAKDYVPNPFGGWNSVLRVVDGGIGFTGGVGIADPGDGHADSKDHWRDSRYQIEGPAVAQMQPAFTDNRIKTRSEVLLGCNYLPGLKPTGKLPAQVFKSSRACFEGNYDPQPRWHPGIPNHEPANPTTSGQATPAHPLAETQRLQHPHSAG